LDSLQLVLACGAQKTSFFLVHLLRLGVRALSLIPDLLLSPVTNSLRGNSTVASPFFIQQYVLVESTVTECLMSSTSSSQSRHDPVEASSSKSPFNNAPSEDNHGDIFDEQDVTDDLLASDPLNDSFDKQ